jgi:hypothetical protein
LISGTTPRLAAAASCSLAVADVQLAEPAQLPAHVIQVERADLIDPQADAGLQPRGRAVPRGRDELAAGGQFLASPGEQPRRYARITPLSPFCRQGTQIWQTAVMHGNEACAANSMSCAERRDLCGEESGWQERGASGPGPVALGQHQGMPIRRPSPGLLAC